MEMEMIEKMKETIREDSKEDEYNLLLGFMTAENDDGEYIKYGKTYVFYLANFSEMTYVDIEVLYSQIKEEEETLKKEKEQEKESEEWLLEYRAEMDKEWDPKDY